MLINKKLVIWILVLWASQEKGYAKDLLPERFPAINEFLQSNGQRYEQVSGMITSYQQDGHYYWEIPDSIQGRDLLVTTTLLKGAARQSRDEDQKYGYAQDMLGPLVVRWQRQDGQLVLQEPLSEELPLSGATVVSELIRQRGEVRQLYHFPICARNEHSTLIEITSFLSNRLVTLASCAFELGIGEREDSKCRIREIKGGNDYILVRTAESYLSNSRGKRKETNGQSTRWEVGYCLRLLPRRLMTIRYAHPRVGYFTQGIREYGKDMDEVKIVRLAKRWRLEPRPEDQDKYLRGELVEPAKPIVFYIDRQIPAKWIPYFIQGVNDWQAAFEQAGFKNAIYGKLAPLPEENPDFSPDNSAYSFISYNASATENAYGHALTDARTGEIVCGRIVLYHGFQNLSQKWYFAQAAMADERARNLILPDSLLGELMKTTIVHEVGHTLGLTHNFIASNVGSPDQLRDPDYLRKHSYTASVMDYSRFNYVAQPEDRLPVEYLINSLGEYDKFAIAWGYRWFPGENPAEEKRVLDDWVTRMQNEKQYRFADNDGQDPRIQAEDISHDDYEAAQLGIKNLHSLMQLSQLWQPEDHLSVGIMKNRYLGVISQFNDYLHHVLKYIGGRYRYSETCAATGVLFDPVSREDQLRALSFLHEYVLNPPQWLYNSDIAGMLRVDAEALYQECWRGVLDDLTAKINNIYRFQQLEKQESYQVKDYLDDLYRMLFREFVTGENISGLRAQQQRYYVRGLKQLFMDQRIEEELRLGVWQELKRIGREARNYIEKIQDPQVREWTQELLEIM